MFHIRAGYGGFSFGVELKIFAKPEGGDKMMFGIYTFQQWTK